MSISEEFILGQMQFNVFTNNMDIGDTMESRFSKFVYDLEGNSWYTGEQGCPLEREHRQTVGMGWQKHDEIQQNKMQSLECKTELVVCNQTG